MDLRGWDYTGRNISPELHRQFLVMIDCLSDPTFTDHATWGNPIQDKLAIAMQMSSSGAVRTVKRMFNNFGFLQQASFSSRNEINNRRLLTDRGQLVYQAAKLEQQVSESVAYDENKKKQIFAEIKKLYEEAYCEALRDFYFTNQDGSHLHPLRATLRALNKYGRLDKWEWYLLNTFIREDDDVDAENELEGYIEQYRAGNISFTMENVVEKPKGHQYTPQHFEFAGLLHVVQRPLWSIADSGKHNDIKSQVLSDTFLESLYQGGS